jgi:hypothetical protein
VLIASASRGHCNKAYDVLSQTRAKRKEARDAVMQCLQPVLDSMRPPANNGIACWFGSYTGTFAESQEHCTAPLSISETRRGPCLSGLGLCAHLLPVSACLWHEQRYVRRHENSRLHSLLLQHHHFSQGLVRVA